MSPTNKRILGMAMAKSPRLIHRLTSRSSSRTFGDFDEISHSKMVGFGRNWVREKQGVEQIHIDQSESCTFYAYHVSGENQERVPNLLQYRQTNATKCVAKLGLALRIMILKPHFFYFASSNQISSTCHQTKA
jgi:hypothetical protein